MSHEVLRALKLNRSNMEKLRKGKINPYSLQDVLVAKMLPEGL